MWAYAKLYSHLRHPQGSEWIRGFLKGITVRDNIYFFTFCTCRHTSSCERSRLSNLVKELSAAQNLQRCVGVGFESLRNLSERRRLSSPFSRSLPRFSARLIYLYSQTFIEPQQHYQCAVINLDITINVVEYKVSSPTTVTPKLDRNLPGSPSPQIPEDIQEGSERQPHLQCQIDTHKVTLHDTVLVFPIVSARKGRTLIATKESQ